MKMTASFSRATCAMLSPCVAVVIFARPIAAQQEEKGVDHVTITSVGDVYISDEGVISRLTDPNSPDRAELVLFVGNQCETLQFAEIVVLLDKTVLLSKNFESVPRHTSYGKYIVHLPNGPHRVEVSSKSAGVAVKRRFNIRDRGWATVDLTDATPRPKAEPRFELSFEFSKEKIWFR